MSTTPQESRSYWSQVLLAGGSTQIPRWTLDPRPGVGTAEQPVAPALWAELSRVATGLGVPVSSVLLAAHAKVLAALSGDLEVSTGYLSAGADRPLPLQLSTEVGSWQALVAAAHQVESDVRRHQDFPLADLQTELGTTGPAFETVCRVDLVDREPDLDREPELADGVVAALDVVPGAATTLRLHYRTDLIDSECADRIVGYHLRALTLIAEDVQAEHEQQSLLSAAETQHQLTGLAGRHRELPERRFHELVQDRVQADPQAVAAVHGDRQWTYAELNARANQLARALLARGLQREGVVAVVTERNLDWMASVLAIFKAGGAYLPIEPHFPADRIARTLTRADCRLALTEPGSRATLDAALASAPQIQPVLVDDAYAEGHDRGDLDVTVNADQLAYIYFTSGSTGEPKGAMCEQAGMLNHLYAKVDDLGIAAGDVVAQTAPQCFDISLWQLVSALLVGGRTLLVEQEVVLDVERFVDRIATGRVAVLQIVPSYLEAVLSYLELHPRALPDLRCVSVTGEALKKELTQRWFAAQPGIVLVNAYGLTETSDDTNHEVMHGVPVRDRVPLGPPISNVSMYVVDEHLRPVPLGAPGAIVFSGVCVGRGYVNDPDRTRQAYLSDPYRPGERLYQGGDFGRWLPEGKLEFLGRRDSQVKISGFRIEIGEIENALLSVPGVRDGAVVVAERADQPKHLVAFYAGPDTLAVDLLRERLGRSLPDYMVPKIYHRLEVLPLTPNSKIDKKKLTGLAAELATEQDVSQPPATPTEERLAAAWSSVLGIAVEQIGRHDHFFDRGGSSLSAVKLAIALDRAVSLKDVTRHPVLADLAAVVDGRQPKRTGLLQSLSDSGPAGEPGAGSDLLVCFPYAGGNAVNFRPLAAALRDSGISVVAVELPGHDLGAAAEPFAPLEQVVGQVVDEIGQRQPRRVLLWGHSSGAAFALATARRLQELGADAAHVFLAAQLAGTASGRRAAATELAGRSDVEIAAGLSSDQGYRALAGLDAPRAAHVGAAYRHDCLSAHHYLAEQLEAPSAEPLAAPVTVVLAADDPGTGAREQLGWDLLAERVDLHELDDGGHYFLRTRPDEAARAVVLATQLETASR